MQLVGNLRTKDNQIRSLKTVPNTPGLTNTFGSGITSG